MPPSVHGTHDHGFIAYLSAIAREKGVVGFPGEGIDSGAYSH